MKDLIQRLRDEGAPAVARETGYAFNARNLCVEAADLIQSQQSRIKELEGALGQVSITRTVRAAHFIARTTLGDKA